MVYDIKKIKIFIMIVLSVFSMIFALSLKGNVETGLLRTFLPKNIDNYSMIVQVSDKTSSDINVIFESSDEYEIDNLKTEFFENLNDDYFEPYNFDFLNSVQNYLHKEPNFLSYKKRKLLKNKLYDEVYSEALEALYNPVNIQISDFKEDPYFLFNDFLEFNGFVSEIKNESDGKYYDLVRIKMKNSDGLSPDKNNKKISELVKLQKKLSSGNSKVYLSGTPIHSYYTSKNSIKNINIICLLSLMLISILVYYYFRSFKPLFPLFLSILFGMTVGYSATKLWFNDFQIITAMFSVTLIGIGADYSFHRFFADKNDIKFIKNLSVSLVTTLLPFCLLYSTGIEILRQIAVFTSFGLVGIYVFVLFFNRCFDIKKQDKTVKIKSCYLVSFLILFIVTGIFGYFHIKFNDSLSALYKPSGELLKAESIYNKLTGGTTSQIIAVKGTDIENILQNEEKITDVLNENNIKYYALSEFLPSCERQKDNFGLVKNLYNNNLYKYAELLSAEQISELKNSSFFPVYADVKNFPFISNFLSDSSSSLIYVFSSENLPVNFEFSNIINMQNDVRQYLKEYRITLLKLLPGVFLLIYIFLSSVYGFKNGLRLLISVALSVIVALGIYGAVFREINLFCIISLFMVIGFTADYSVFRLNGNEHTENAVFVSCMTSAFSFLLLSFCGFALLKSIAFILFCGIISAWLFGFFIFREPDNSSDKKWFEIKEQSAGEKRLIITKYLYHIFGKNALYVIAFFVSLFTVIFSKSVRYYSYEYFKTVSEYTHIKPDIFTVFKHVSSYAYSLADKVLIYSDKFDTSGIVFESEEKRQSVYSDIEQKKGVFFICNHIGNIEVMQSLLRSEKTKINSTVNIFLSNQQSRIFNNFLKTIKVEMPVRIFSAEETGIDTFIEIKENLDKGDIVFMAGDRISENNYTKTQSGKIFDNEVLFPSGVFKAAELFGVPVWFISAIKTGKKYTIFAEKQETTDMSFIVKKYSEFTERMILINPYQFFHFYDFFKKRY